MSRAIALIATGCLLAASHAAVSAPYPPRGADPQPAGAADAAAPVAPSSPHEIVGFGVNELRRFLMHDRERDPQSVEAFLEEAVAPYFDFETMGRWAAGPFYRDLDREQRARFHDKIRDMFLEALARNLGSYALAVPPVQIFPPVSQRWGDEMTVRARVFPPGTYPLSLDFRFHHRDGQWRVFDVAANGFSAVSFYRHHFAALVRAGGPHALYR